MTGRRLQSVAAAARLRRELAIAARVMLRDQVRAAVPAKSPARERK